MVLNDMVDPSVAESCAHILSGLPPRESWSNDLTNVPGKHHNMCRQSLLLFWVNRGRIVQGSPACSVNVYTVDVNTCRQFVSLLVVKWEGRREYYMMYCWCLPLRQQCKISACYE